MSYIRCVSCGGLIANKYLQYNEGVREIENKDVSTEEKQIMMKELLDSLHVPKYCCRMRIMANQYKTGIFT